MSQVHMSRCFKCNVYISKMKGRALHVLLTLTIEEKYTQRSEYMHFVICSYLMTLTVNLTILRGLRFHTRLTSIVTPKY